MLLIFYFASLLAAIQLPDTSAFKPLAPRFKERQIFKGKLENGLKLYIISDPSSEESAAALSVGKGSWHEPEAFPGLAHYLEHMLFMGTKSHPDEYSFTQFLKENSGDSNAYTEDLYTTYLFRISNSAFPEALARFSEFFREPLLKSSAMNREIQAITQEFQGSLNSDTSRRVMVYKALGNPLHPIHRFNFGSKETLGSAKADDLRNWMQKEYQPEEMLLIMISSLPIGELVKKAEEDFGALTSSKTPQKLFPETLFSKEVKGTIVYTKPIQEKNSLVLSWELNDPLSFSKESKPDVLLCYVLGDEGKGSLLAKLKEEGLALELNCGLQRWSDSERVFVIDIDLTEKGSEQPYTVMSRVFQAIEFLKTHPFPKRLFEEVKEIKELETAFPESEPPFEEAYTLSKLLRFEPLESFPRETYILETFNAQAVEHLLSELTPNKALINIMSSKETYYDQEEPWMKVPYRIEPLDSSKIENIEPFLSYPEPNPYIPKDLQLHAPRQETPVQLLFESEQIQLFGKVGNSFGTPQIFWNLRIESPALSYADPKNAVLADLWINLFRRLFTEEAYAATLSGLSYDLSVNQKGLKISLTGFSEHAPLFLKNLLHFAKALKPTEEIFQREKEDILRTLRSSALDSPYKQALELLRETLIIPNVTSSEKYEALEKVTRADFTAFQQALFETLSIKALSIGDQTLSDQEKLFNLLTSALQGKPAEPLSRRVLILPEDLGPFILQKDSNSLGSALLLAIQNPDFTFEHYAHETLLSRLIEDPFFQTLRGEQQTAYLIDSSIESVEKTLLSLFLLESYSYDPRDLLARVELFLEQVEIQETAFDATKLSLVNELKEKPHSLEEEGKRLSDLLFLREGNFLFMQELRSAMEGLSFKRFQELTETLLSASNRRRLALLIHGRQNEMRGPKYEVLSSPEALQKILWRKK